MFAGKAGAFKVLHSKVSSCGLYYKHMMIIDDDSRVIIKWSSKLIDPARGKIYDCLMFIVQATGDPKKNFFGLFTDKYV